MAVEVLYDKESNQSCFYDNTSGVAFGPVMDDTDREEAHDFMELIGEDLRMVEEDELLNMWATWQETR